MRQAPDNTSFYLFGKYNPNEKTGKQKRFEEIIKSSTEVRHIGAIPGMKFVFDENCQLDWEEPPRVINAQSLRSCLCCMSLVIWLERMQA